MAQPVQPNSSGVLIWMVRRIPAVSLAQIIATTCTSVGMANREEGDGRALWNGDEYGGRRHPGTAASPYSLLTLLGFRGGRYRRRFLAVRHLTVVQRRKRQWNARRNLSRCHAIPISPGNGSARYGRGLPRDWPWGWSWGYYLDSWVLITIGRVTETQ